MPAKDILLGVDIGTTAVRAFAFDYDGGIVKDSKMEVKMNHPRSGWAEESPEELYTSTLKALKNITKGLGNRIRAIGFTGQMHGLCCLDREGKPLTNLIPWADVRAGEQAQKLGAKIGSHELYEKTGCPPLFIYVAPKILWVKENLPEVFAKTRKFVTAQDYVVFKIFGDYYTNPSLASGSQLLNIRNVDWDSTVLEAVGIEESLLPKLVEGDTVFSTLPRERALDLGLDDSVPVALGASDGSLSNIGMGAVQKNVGGLNLGSSGAIRVVSKQPLLDREMRFFCYYIASKNWLVGGAVNNCGIILRWFRDNFGQKETEQAKERNIDVYRLLDEQAAKVPPGSDGLLFLPFLAGERFPIRDPYVRGMLFGLDLAHGKPHVIRSMMEGVTYTLKWILDAIEEHLELDEIRVSGGGARSALWRQIVSDVCGKKVVKTDVEEASSLGAAMFAGIAVGDFHGLEDASKKMVRGGKSQEPSQQTHEYYNKIFELYKSTYQGCRTYCQKLLEIEQESRMVADSEHYQKK